MKIIILCSVLYTALFYVTIFTILIPTLSTKDWCWTKSMANDPSYIFNSSNGGINWGYCKPKDLRHKSIKYVVELVTSSLPKSGTESDVNVQIYGTRGMTQRIKLGRNIEAGSTKKFEIDGNDVGEINKLNVKAVGTQGYRCKEIRVKKSGGYFKTFQCLKALKPCKPGGSQFHCQEELLPQGGASYDITLKTSREPGSNTDSPILVGLIGDKGVSNFQMISEIGARVNSQITNTIKIKDIGKVTGYQIKLTENGKWKGSYMIIKNIKTGTISQFDLKDVVLENPGRDFYKYDSSPSVYTNENTIEKKSPVEGSTAKSSNGFSKLFDMVENSFNNKDNSEEDDDDGLLELTQEVIDNNQAGNNEATLEVGVGDGVNIHDPNGGLLDQNEKKKVVNLNCLQKLINTDPTSDTFGPNYPTSNVEYLNILARCPSNCHTTQGQVFGLGLHPDISPICLSALADKAISQYGGIISISIYPGLDKYVILDQYNKIKLGKIKISSFFGHTKKSYTISKVDNVDLIEKDIRILDHKGKISHEGRVEIRLNGQWGTICNKNNNVNAAKRICKDLGYNDGKWKSPEGSVDFCRTFKGQDYCGSENYKVLFSDIICHTDKDNFSSCTKKYANPNECTHNKDSILSCTSKSYESGNMTPNGTIRLKKVLRNPKYVIGRLELFNKKHFNPVCKNGFNSDAANVACRQMGYDSGDIINPDPEKHFTKGKDDPSPFSASKVKCRGNEKNIFECMMKLNDIKCTHDLDVVLKCEGNKGDYTGKSQAPGKNMIESRPALGKLTMIKLKGDCKLKGNSPKLRGDPGSVYIIKCPAHCANESASLWGLGIYSVNSNICQAAIHSGIITDEKGGSVAFTKIWGQKYYRGYERNGITSNELTDKVWASFTLSAMNSQWKNMWILFKENKVGTFIEKSIQIKLNDNSNFGMNNFKSYTSSFTELELNSELTTELNSGLNTSIQSEMNLETGAPKPVFEWIEIDPSHNFSDKEKGSVLIEEHELIGMTKYQIIIKASMADFKNKKAFLFSYSGCGGFNVYLDETDTLIFGDSCNESNQINTGIPFALNDKTLIWAFYNNSKLKVAVFNEKSNKPIAKIFSKNIDFPTGKNIGIGRKADAKGGFFYGFIELIQIYKDEIPFSMISKILDEINSRNKVPVPEDDRQTVDNRHCVSPCSDSPIPGQPGAPEPPKVADPYAGSDNSAPGNSKSPAANPLISNFLLDYKRGIISNPNPGMKSSYLLNDSEISPADKFKKSEIMKAFSRKEAFRNLKSFHKMIGTANINSSSKTSSSSPSNSANSNQKSGNGLSETYGTYDKKEQNNIESIVVDCQTNLKDKRFTGSVGRIFRVKCPSCHLQHKPIYGSFIYHPLSSVCKAANHAGSLNSKESGYIIVEIISGKKIYNGSVGADGNVSGTFSASEKSFRTKKGTSPLKISCSDSPNKEPFANAPQGQKFVVMCPKNCGKEKVPIFGSEIYTDTSPICVSAIHYGVLNDIGGEIEFLIEGPQTFFKATKSFGIFSKQKDAYIRSFRFIGIKSSIFYKFKENFLGKITEKWEIHVTDEVEDRNQNNWSYEEKRLKIFDENKLIKYIVHKGSIKSKIKNNYGSMLFLKNAQWSNGRVKSNFMFKDQKPFALLFKFVDPNNYYALQFNPKQEKGGIVLMSKIVGSVKIIDTKSIRLNVDVWYRIEILMKNDNITINIQNDIIRENKTYFDLKLEQLSRGTIAFATNGNNQLYINGIEIDDYIPHAGKKLNDKNKRSWIDLIKRTDDKNKKKYCQSVYSLRKEISRCVEPQYYCRLKCDEHIPTIENILNFNCYRSCVKKIKSNHSEIKIQKTEWSPKIGEKIDFLPKNEKEYKPATIASIKIKKVKGHNIKTYFINYFDNAGNILKATSPFPDKRIVKCSEKLKIRKDCK